MKQLFNNYLCWAYEKIGMNKIIFCGQKFSLLKKKNRYIKYIKEKPCNNIKIKNNQFFYANALENNENIEKNLYINKLRCKYRKSCYNNYNESVPKNKILSINKTEKLKEKNEKNITDNADLKKKCKYRYSCYDKNRVNKLEEKNFDKKSTKIFTSKVNQKKSFNKLKKIKDNANDLAKKKYMNKLNKENSNKNNCKYRKSCYKTGILSKINKLKWTINIDQFFEIIKTKFQEKKIDEPLKENEKKLICKYRKSCYKNKVPKQIINKTQKNETDTISNNLNKNKISMNENKTVQINLKTKKKLAEEFSNKITKNEKNNLGIKIDSINFKKVKNKQLNKIKKIETEKIVKSKNKFVKINKKVLKEKEKLKNFETVKSKNKLKNKEIVENKSEIFLNENEELIENAAEMIIASTIKSIKSNEKNNITLESNKIEETTNKLNTTVLLTNELNETSNKIVLLTNKLNENDKIMNKLNKIDLNNIKNEEKLKCKYKKSCYTKRFIKSTLKTNNKILSAKNLQKKNKETNLNNKQKTTNSDTKQKCKYRKSCYTNFDELNTLKTIIINQNIINDRNQPTLFLSNKKTCSKYRISCREKVGLPPILLQPIAKNGKKLCKKIKKFV